MDRPNEHARHDVDLAICKGLKMPRQPPSLHRANTCPSRPSNSLIGQTMPPSGLDPPRIKHRA
eukprot:3065746-Lingulodinium_polyedra.AAC.1